MEASESPYNNIAGMYHRYWSDWYLPAALPALEKLFFRRLPPDSSVLDVCCGSGHVTQELVRRGYRVNGVDGSAELIALAQAAIPNANFSAQDVRGLRLSERFDSALSTFDSFNHLLSLDDLEAALQSVRAVLKPGGLFVFDMNLEQAYELDLHNWNTTVDDDSVSLVRGTFDVITKLATTELIWFVKDNAHHWQRRDSKVQERCYSREEILRAMERAGFREIEHIPAIEAGVSLDLGFGREFFSARA